MKKIIEVGKSICLFRSLSAKSNYDSRELLLFLLNEIVINVR